MAIALTLRDRASLVLRALAGSLPTEPGTIGAKMLGGVIPPGGTPPRRGTREVLASYRAQPWLRAVAGHVSFDVATARWHLYAKRVAVGGKMKYVRDGHVVALQRPGQAKALQKAVEAGEVSEVLTHPLLDLIAGFNTFHTGLDGMQVTQLHIDLAGEGFWLLERNALGVIVALWPLPPHWITGTPSMTRPGFTVSFQGWQGVIPATEIVWFAQRDPENPYARGSGTAQALGDELETDEYASRHIKAFYFNRARPDLIVSPKSDDGDGMQEAEVRRLEEGWHQRSGGFWRAFRPFFVRRAIDVKELAQDFKSQQLLGIREFERDTIIQVFGVSPEILGILKEGASRATITMAEYIYGRRTLTPRLERLRSTLQERVVPEFDERLIVGYDSPVGRDQELELKAAEQAPWALTLNEWRRRMGEPPLDGTAGDVHMMTAVLTPMRAEELQMRQPAPAPDDEGDDALEEQAAWMRDLALR